MDPIALVGRFWVANHLVKLESLKIPRKKQGSHASWKVLDFFSKNFQDLESPGK